MTNRACLGAALLSLAAICAPACDGDALPEEAGPPDCANVDWGVGEERALDLDAFLVTIADLAAAADDLGQRTAAGCEAIATGLGEPAPGAGIDLVERVPASCAGAQQAIAAVLPGAGLSLSVQKSRCKLDGVTQSACEAVCSGVAACSIPDVIARCAEGDLAGDCAAQCTGSCEGSATASVNCTGVCQGACDGACSGSSTGTACMRTCEGACGGSCEPAPPPAMAPCDGLCAGGCSVDLTAPVCLAELGPPAGGCAVPAPCATFCAIREAAAARCDGVGVGIGASAPGVDVFVSVLGQELPALLPCMGRVPLLSEQVDALLLGPGLGPLTDLSEAGEQCIHAGAVQLSRTGALVLEIASACSGVSGQLGL